jgi:hypothetical protein
MYRNLDGQSVKPELCLEDSLQVSGRITWEVEMGGCQFEGSPGKKHETVSEKTKHK